MQGLKPTEDERKLQTKRFVEQCVEVERLKPPLDDCGNKDEMVVSTKVGAFFVLCGKYFLELCRKMIK